MTAFTLKMIALIAMVIDHVGGVFPDQTFFEFRLIGRLTFPIFVYLIAEGFRHTKSPEKFLLRLFAFALISEIPYDWAVNRADNIQNGLSPWHVDFLSQTNIFYTLFLGGLAIVFFQYIHKSLTQNIEDRNKITVYLSIGLITAIATLGIMWQAESLGTDYGGYGVLFILLMYVIKPKWPRIAVFAIMNVLQHRWMYEWFVSEHTLPLRYYWLIPATLATVPLILLYNGKRGRSLKWLFYAAYPVHLVILAVIAHFVFI